MTNEELAELERRIGQEFDGALTLEEHEARSLIATAREAEALRAENARLREREAQRLYSQECANDPTMHCNRFPLWEELPETERKRRVAALEQGEAAILRAERNEP